MSLEGDDVKILMLLRGDDAKDWFYKGEGAANLVLGYSGSSPFLIGKVLRIQKVEKGRSLPANACIVLTNHERLIWEDVSELVESSSKDVAARAFVQYVMSNLLNSKNIDAGILVPVSVEFLEAIEKNVNDLRPSWRVNASKIDTLCGSALLISDHSIISGVHSAPKCNFCFAVEIKPKCGFLPSSEYIAKANNIKKHVTRFKMHQFLKYHQGEISEISEYDPLHLFSGSKDRILLAIKALFECPQNNFRIFMNGSLVFGGLGGSLDNTVAYSHKAKAAIAASGIQLASFLELVAEIIYESGILARLLEAQQLDVLDIEGAIHLYYNIISQPCAVCEKLNDAERHQYSVLHSLPFERSLKLVRDFLIAVTAKDCSLMICLRPAEDGCTASNYDSIILRSSNQSYDYKAYFIDLDLKHLKKMVHYYELDKKIVNHYKINQVEGRGPTAEVSKLTS